ncbi:MAG: hypothetical protein WA875_14895 [Candidatus Acidiferrales bacterium]
MRTLWRGFVRTIFWSYERGSWPYDVMVIAIVIFVLLTPGRWFHDRPPAAAASSSNVELISQNPDDHTRVYRLDATALPPEKRTAHSTPELEREAHDILNRKVDALHDQTFQIVRIDPQMAGDGSIASYDVTIHP